MNNVLNISTGEVRLDINGDPTNQLVFNPDDVVFAEKFYKLAQDFSVKQVDFTQRISDLEADKTEDAYGIPANTGGAIALTKELCIYVREQIDNVFGEGVSQRLFGNANSINMLEQFFVGIEPYVVKARDKKMKEYIARKDSPVMK